MEHSLPTLKELKQRGTPEPGRSLTPEERALAKTKAKSRRFGSKGEQWLRQRMIKLMGAEMRKLEDTVQQYEKDGEIHTFYRSAGVDYEGSMPMLVHGEPVTVPFVMEVKTFSGSFSLSSISATQRCKLTDSRKEGKLPLVGLVEHDGQGRILHGWVIIWREDGPRGHLSSETSTFDWLDLLMNLDLIATQDKRFKGKSIRQKDQYLMEKALIEKVSGRWRLCPWLEQVKVVGQMELL